MINIVKLVKISAIGLLFASHIPVFALEAQTEEPKKLAEAIFAGGCFWCMEPPYDTLPGVVETISGYIGGHVKNPTYKQVTGGKTGHYEVLKVTYDPAKVSYQTLVDVFWKNIDPLDGIGQFCDKGPQYLSAVFYVNQTQKSLAEQSKRRIQKLLGYKQKVVTEILDAKTFYPAEDYHQDYYQKNPVRYKYYRYRCGRDARLEALWGKAG